MSLHRSFRLIHACNTRINLASVLFFTTRLASLRCTCVYIYRFYPQRQRLLVMMNKYPPASNNNNYYQVQSLLIYYNGFVLFIQLILLRAHLGGLTRATSIIDNNIGELISFLF